MRVLRHRSGTTLIELIIFVAIISVIAAVFLPLLFSATEDRQLQQTASLVEQNGAQLLQAIEKEIRQAERILSPSLQSTGSLLNLQSGSGDLNPTIIGIDSGSLIVVHHTARQTISSSQVAVQQLVFRNTSTSATRQSVFVSFRVSRTIRLQAPRKYSKVFQGVFTLPPDDVVSGDSCHCATAGCDGAGNYVWEVCESAVCLEAQTVLMCP